MRDDLLRDLGRRGHAADGGDTDDGVEIAPLEEIHEVTAQNAPDARNQQGKNPQDEQFEHRGVEQRVRVAQHAQQDSQEKRRTVEHRSADEIVHMLESRLLDHHTDEEREEERSGHREEQAQDHAHHHGERNLGRGAVLLHRFLRRFHLDGAQTLGDHRPHQVGIAAVGQAEIEIGDDGDRHEDLLREVERSEKHHRPVGPADHRDRGAVAGTQPHRIGDRQHSERAQLGAQREEHALQGLRQHEIDVEHRPDAHENQTGYQSVAEREGVDRLQEVDLQNVHQLVGFRDHGVQKQVAVHAARKNQHPGVHRRHAQPHRNHHQRFEHAPAPQVNQQDAQQNQPDTRIHDRGIGLQQGRDSLENIAKIKPFHGAARINGSSRCLAVRHPRGCRGGIRPERPSHGPHPDRRKRPRRSGRPNGCSGRYAQCPCGRRGPICGLFSTARRSPFR